MERLPHLKFVQKLKGSPRLYGGGKTSERSKDNKVNRQRHSEYLKNLTLTLKDNWGKNIDNRNKEEHAALDKEIIPIFLQINPDLLQSLDFNLEKFGIEIISEENDGFIVGASLDGLNALEEKIEGFLNEQHGSGKVADFWEIIVGNREEWKPRHILSEELYSNWNEIDNEHIYQVEVGVAFDKPMGEEPDPNKQGGERRLAKYREKQVLRDEMAMIRESHFDEFIRHYGRPISSFIDLIDSFSCEVEITGLGLKDLVINYPFVFEVAEIDQIASHTGNSTELNDRDLELIAPHAESPEVCVIDSGIMEGHKYLNLAINSSKSQSYVVGDASTVDKVPNGGHGTKVAGMILYPQGITSLEQPYQLPFFVRNIRVLDAESKLLNQFPAELMAQIVENNSDCSIFNLSINSTQPYRLKHMSSWAASLDKLIHEKGILFVVSAGNLTRADIKHFINNGVNYPDYLAESYCRLANPAQSCFSLVVGSINFNDFEDNDWESLGNKEEISAFSRVGSGIWGMIKPDVVEIGGGLVISRNGGNLITENGATSLELIRSTLNGGSAYSSDSVGTSFATPKVSSIVAKLRELYVDENVNLIRALVVRGARLPGAHFREPSMDSLRRYGYGVPSLERVTNNTTRRVTFYNSAEISAEEGHVYSLKIPEAIRNQANEYEVLLEVTLTFTASVRRTRQKSKSYLSTWLSWTSSYFDESFEDFKNRALRIIEGEDTEYEPTDGDVIKWNIRENKDWGNVKEYNRNNSSVQKDWVVLKAFELSETISFAVQAHKGWDANKEKIPYAISVSLESLDADIPVYETVRLENEIEIES